MGHPSYRIANEHMIRHLANVAFEFALHVSDQAILVSRGAPRTGQVANPQGPGR
jgi:hypothetical protein